MVSLLAAAVARLHDLVAATMEPRAAVRLALRVDWVVAPGVGERLETTRRVFFVYEVGRAKQTRVRPVVRGPLGPRALRLRRRLAAFVSRGEAFVKMCFLAPLSRLATRQCTDAGGRQMWRPEGERMARHLAKRRRCAGGLPRCLQSRQPPPRQLRGRRRQQAVHNEWCKLLNLTTRLRVRSSLQRPHVLPGWRSLSPCPTAPSVG